MARPSKTGLDYFPFDVDTFQDIKIRKLIKYQGGKAVTVYALLLCLIYKSGYYMRWDEELPFIVSEQTGFEEAYISEVIKSCVALGLFSKGMFDEGVLTSKGIQERYLGICRQMKRGYDLSEYALVISEETGVSSGKTKVSSGKIRKNSEETGVSSELTGVSPEKFRLKERKRKEKEISPDGDRKKNAAGAAPPSPGGGGEKGLEACKGEIASDREWMETVCLNEHITERDFHAYLDGFFRLLQNRGDTRKSPRDAKHHFASWLRIELKNRDLYAKNNDKAGGNPSAGGGGEDFMRNIAEGIARANYEKQRRGSACEPLP